MDQYDFILIVSRSLSLLSIILGSILLLVSFSEVKGFKLAFFEIESFKLASRTISVARATGLTIFLLGCLIGFFPTTVTVHGTVTNNVTPANGALVSINGDTKMVCEDGSFTYFDVPKNASYIEYTYKGIIHRAELKIPYYWAIFNINGSYNFKFPCMTIEGNITDESGKIPSDIQISILPMTQKGYNSFVDFPDAYGQYKFDDIPCENPIKIFVNKILPNNIIQQSQKLNAITVHFNDEDINLGYKRIDLCTKKTINVEGTVTHYCDGFDENPIPVIGAKVDIGGRSNITNYDGKYLIKNVPIDSIEYKVKLISRVWKNDSIIPPLSDEPENGDVTVRDLYICY